MRYQILGRFRAYSTHRGVPQLKLGVESCTDLVGIRTKVKCRLLSSNFEWLVGGLDEAALASFASPNGELGEDGE